jgi:hypothetical protein
MVAPFPFIKCPMAVDPTSLLPDLRLQALSTLELRTLN